MTNEIVFKTRVDTGTTSKDLAAISTELGKIDQGAKTVGSDSAAQLEALNKKIAAGGMTTRQLTRSVQEYMTIARDAGRTSPVGQAAIQQAAMLTDELGDLRNEIVRASHDGANMQAALQLGGTVVAGYGVAQGAMAMLGVENEKLMETMVKLQAATSVLNGIEQIRANLERESFMMQKAKIVQTKVLTAATAVYSAVVGTSTGALRLFRLALIATGIGAIVVGIGLLIANFDKLIGYVKQGIAAFTNLGEGVKLALSIIFPFIGMIRLAYLALEKMGVIATEESKTVQRAAQAQLDAQVAYTKQMRSEIDKRIADNNRHQYEINDMYDFEIAKAKAAGKDTTALEAQKREEMRKTLEEQVKNLELSLKFNATSASEMMRITKEIATTRAALLDNERQDELATITANTNNRKKGAEQAKETAKQEADAKAKELERERLLRDYFIASIDDENVKKLVQLQEQHKREREELVKKYGEDAALIKNMEAKQFDEMNALRKEQASSILTKRKEEIKAQQELQRRDEMAGLQVRLVGIQDDFEAEMEVKRLIWQMERDEELANADLTENEKLLIKANYNQKILDADKERQAKELELEKQTNAQKELIQKQAFDSVNNLAETAFAIADGFGKQDEKSKEKRARAQFKVQKAMQLGLAINDAYKAITASLAQSPVAIGAVPNPAGIASLAFAATTGAANIAKIAASKFGGGGGGLEPPPPPPDIPPVGAPEATTQQNNNTTQTAGLINRPSKVVVVDSEIKAVMDGTQQIEVVSSFG